LPYHQGFLEENEEEMVLGKIRKIALTTCFYTVRGVLLIKKKQDGRLVHPAIFIRIPLRNGRYR
ncbi:MAG TPA: hypothetical protein PKW64_11510, partial [Segatella copri]|nr:hypothetical protein [Segatella copri]